jgi:hypothetical protein
MSDWLYLLGALVLWALTVLAGAMWSANATRRDVARVLKGDEWPTFSRLRELRCELYWARLDRERDRTTIAQARRQIANHAYENRLYIERAKRAEAELAALATDARALAQHTLVALPGRTIAGGLAQRVLERTSVKALLDQGRIN